MDKLPKLSEPVPEATPEEIFETNPRHVGEDSVEATTADLEMVPTPEEEPKKPARKKYTRDPEDLKSHMKMMREKAAEARKKRKSAAEQLQEQEQVQTRNRSNEEAFAQFMQFYSVAEQAKAERQREIDAEVQKKLRAEKKKHAQSRPPRSKRKKFYPGVNTPLDANRGDGRFDVTAPSSVYKMYNGYQQRNGFH